MVTAADILKGSLKCKCCVSVLSPDFIIGLKSELERFLSSHQPKTVSKTLPDVHFSHCPDFVIGLKSELEHCLSSHQPKTVTKTLPDAHFSHAEDFPVDIVDKIFSPMSQAGGCSSNSKSMSTASRSVCVSINNAEKQSGYTSSNSFEASSDATNSLQSSSLDQSKQLLRDKMAKLLAYDQPAPLERLPSGGSPACKKEFKSPSTKKTS